MPEETEDEETDEIADDEAAELEATPEAEAADEPVEAKAGASGAENKEREEKE